MTWTIQRKQYLFIGLLLALQMLAGVVGWRSVHLLSREFRMLVDHNLAAATALSKAERGLWELRFGLPNYIIGDAAARQKIKDESARWLQQVDEGMRAYTEKELSAAEKETLTTWQQSFQAYMRTRPTFFELMDANKVNEAREFRARETNPAAAAAVSSLARLNNLQKELSAQREVRITTIAGSATTMLIALLLAGLAGGVTVALFTGRLVRPLRRTVDVLNSVARGDFTRRLDVDTKDEIGQMAAALNAAVGAMRAALQEVSAAAGNAASASQELSAAAEQLSSGAEEQASSLEETAASLEEITGTVKQNADNAKQADQLAVGSRAVAEKGAEVVAEAVQSMGAINQASKKIAAIITTIDEIAFQTNLLALNAAVEAARAGEQGRGFAVVASEVRNLAQRSAAAAKEIKGLIEDSVAKVETGAALVNQSGENLGEIVTSVKRVTDIIGEIAAASTEQTTGIEQVNKAVTQMDRVTQANAAQTEELSSTAQALAAQAEQLQALVSRFELGEERAGVPVPDRSHVGAPVVAKQPAPRPTPPKPPAAKGSSGKPAPALVASHATNGHGAGDGFEEF